MIDLRSDTVTKPTPEMLEAMMQAKVGDDVFGEDPTILALEKELASMFGMEEGVFCPSGTMTNQIALNILSAPYDEVICYQGSHVYRYEGGGGAGNSGLSFKLLDSPTGILSIPQIEEAINPDDPHFPVSSVLSLENTVNKAGGTYYQQHEIEGISVAARNQGLHMHLDGARIFNALVASGQKPSYLGGHFETISVCLSKGLGAPVGSVLLMKKKWVKKARRMRKVFGGGMRQGGYLAAAGLYALENHVDRLEQDHRRAATLAEILAGTSFVQQVFPVYTNIVLYQLEGVSMEQHLSQLGEVGIKAVPFGKEVVRLVTHLDIHDQHLEQFAEAVKKI